MPDKRPERKPADWRSEVFKSCPHCGRELSPWERVLLGVDRALMCKHCWYRIILNAPDEQSNKKAEDQSEDRK